MWHKRHVRFAFTTVYMYVVRLSPYYFGTVHRLAPWPPWPLVPWDPLALEPLALGPRPVCTRPLALGRKALALHRCPLALRPLALRPWAPWPLGPWKYIEYAPSNSTLIPEFRDGSYWLFFASVSLQTCFQAFPMTVNFIGND